MFGGESRPVVARLIETGNLTLDDVEFAEKTLKELRERRQVVTNSFLLSVGSAMGNHLWQTTVAAAVIWLLNVLLHKNPAPHSLFTLAGGVP